MGGPWSGFGVQRRAQRSGLRYVEGNVEGFSAVWEPLGAVLGYLRGSWGALGAVLGLNVELNVLDCAMLRAMLRAFRRCGGLWPLKRWAPGRALNFDEVSKI